MSEFSSDERVLFVHAHPDDETLATGGTIATLVDAGAEVVLLTLTRGERGEVVPDDLAHLIGDPKALGSHRAGELSKAAEILGIRDHRFLGDERARLAGREPRPYRDSGMVWLDVPKADLDAVVSAEESTMVAGALEQLDPESLLAADYGEVVTDVATVVADVRPTAIVSYDANGGYGHPDHVLAHDAASHAAEVLGVPFFAIVASDTESPRAVRVDVSPVLRRKREAIAQYRSQLTLDGDTIVHSGGQRSRLSTVEAFERRRAVERPVVSVDSFGVGAKTAGGIMAIAAGATVGALGTVNHQLAFIVGEEPWAIGVLLSLLLAGFLLAGLRLVSRGRWLALLAGAAMVAVVALMATLSPGGSVLVPNNPAGVAWVYGVPILVAILVGWPRVQRSVHHAAIR